MTDYLAWTAELVRERLREALATLRRLSVARGGPSERVTSWPDAPNVAAEAYGYEPIDADAVARLSRPTRAEITRMEEVLGWIAMWGTHAACRAAGIAADAAWIALKRAEGWEWRAIVRHRVARSGGGQSPGGNSKPSLLKLERQALAYLAERLTTAGVLVRPAGGRVGEEDMTPRALESGPGALPRAMAAARPVRNARPCGTCQKYLGRARGLDRSKCVRFNVAVNPLYHAYAPPGEPCWVPKAATAASA